MTWTIAELAERAAGVLAASPHQANGRVRDVPNERLIRWYVTVGLVDPPLSRKGRVARYGERHLLQLVAVKRRQAEGRTLAEIQQELAGATDEILAAAAAVPAPGPGPGAAAPDTARATPVPAPAAADRFWARRPPAPPAPGQPALADGDHPDRGGPGLVHGVRLAPGVVLLLEGAGQAPDPDDMTAIANAAQPLLSALAGRGLCPPDLLLPSGAEPEAEGA